ncbi:A nuclease of the HNH/ENDO VII superfamily with conserved WHH [Priestia aryabhattai B8W22]|nr:A nuclease of the HNH/ENDO VII superfamily with conserved WHH [Priestia aryabhattai B8W22]
MTGRDMFGNKISEEQRKASLLQALGIAGAGALSTKVAGKMGQSLATKGTEKLNNMRNTLRTSAVANVTKQAYQSVKNAPASWTQSLHKTYNNILDSSMPRLGPELAPAGPALAQQTVRETLQNVKQQTTQIAQALYNPTAKRYQDPETGRFVANPNVERVEKPVVKEVEKVQEVTKGTGNVNLKNIDEFIDGAKTFDDVVNDFARLYSEKIQTNKTWSWNKSFHGGEYLTARQRKLIKEKAIADGLIPNVNVIKADGMRYGFADFKGAGLVVEAKDLPESLWLKSDEAQFEWLDNVIGGRPEGMTWHHTEVPGKMELVPFGIHNITIHNGGRSTGMWADAPR